MSRSRITREQLERPLQQLGRELEQRLPTLVGVGERVGFVLMLFDFGDGGHLAYVSNAERAGVVGAVKEWLARVDGEPTIDRPEPVV